jgi:hydrogenase maturation protease
MRGLVIGLGHDDRADDAAGPMVARLVAPHLPGEWCTTEHHGDLTALVDLCAGIDEVVIVDAIVSGAPAGTVHHVVLDDDPAPSFASAGSSHGLGLLDALALGRTLGHVRGRVSLVGIEARQVAVGAPMTFEVQVALPLAAARVLEDALATTA